MTMGAISESQDLVQFETPYQAKGNKARHANESQFWSSTFWERKRIEDEHFYLYLEGDAHSHPSYFDETSNGEEGTPVAMVYATSPKELTWRGQQRLLQDFLESLPVSASRGSLVRRSNRVRLFVSLDGKSVPELKKDFVKRWETHCEAALKDSRNKQNSRWHWLKPDFWLAWAKIPYQKYKGNFELMKKAFSKLRQFWQRFWEPTEEIPFIIKLLLGVLVVATVAVMVSDSLQQLLSEKYDVLKTIGFCIAGVVSIWLALSADKRANAMDATAKNTEAGQRQERLKNAIEHLGHKRESVRMSGAYELFHLAKDTENEDLRQTVMDILCAHIRQMTTDQTTRGKDYQAEHKSKPSEEIQSLLTLLFREKHDIFKDCPINLQGSYLNGATLSQARLKRANLMEAQLQEADLREAQLQEADFVAARLQRAKLMKARLQGAILVGAQMQGAGLSYAKMQNADLSDAQMQGAVLRHAQLQGANLRPKVQGGDSRPVKLQMADLLGAQLQGTNLMEAQLPGADLSGAQLQGANLISAQLQGADLSMAQLQGAFLMAARLQGAELWEAQLQGVSSFANDSIPSAGFESRMRDRIGKDSDLTRIIFSGRLQEEDLHTLCEGLSDDLAQVLREKLRPHVGQPAKPTSPRDAKAGAYTQEEAEQWIAEYQEAMREVPKRDEG